MMALRFSICARQKFYQEKTTPSARRPGAIGARPTGIPPVAALPESARGLAQSKTLRAVCKSPVNASRLGLRQPSAAFPRT